MKPNILFAVLLLGLSASAQDSIVPRLKGVYFPYPMERAAKFSIGFTSTTMPYDVTEELHFRVPAVEARLLKRISKSLQVDARASIQVFQNLVTLGPRWVKQLNDRYSIGIGNDVGFWFGQVDVETVKTTGRGFQNLPNFSIGRRFNRGVLLTVRADAQMNFGIQTFAKETEITTPHRLLSGSSYAVILEQPFAGNKAVTVGFRAIYTDFFWQTWTLFETFDRNIFYPQVIVGLNL